MGCVFKSSFLSAHKSRSKWLNFWDLRTSSSIVLWNLFVDIWIVSYQNTSNFSIEGSNFNISDFSIYLINAIIALLCVFLFDYHQNDKMFAYLCCFWFCQIVASKSQACFHFSTFLFLFLTSFLFFLSFLFSSFYSFSSTFICHLKLELVFYHQITPAPINIVVFAFFRNGISENYDFRNLTKSPKFWRKNAQKIDKNRS